MMIFPRDKNHSCLQLLQTAVPAQVPWAMLTAALLNYPMWQVLPLIHEEINSLPKTLRIYSYGLGEFQGHFCIPAPSTRVIHYL